MTCIIFNKGYNIEKTLRLDLTYNQINQLPPEIGNLQQLQYLYLHDYAVHYDT